MRTTKRGITLIDFMLGISRVQLEADAARAAARDARFRAALETTYAEAHVGDYRTAATGLSPERRLITEPSDERRRAWWLPGWLTYPWLGG